MKKLLIAITISTVVCLVAAPGHRSCRAIYSHYPHHHSTSTAPGRAARAGHHKLIQWFDETICGPGNTLELYNLKDDIPEQNNLAKKTPQKGKKIKNVMMTCPN